MKTVVSVSAVQYDDEDFELRACLLVLTPAVGEVGSDSGWSSGRLLMNWMLSVGHVQ